MAKYPWFKTFFYSNSLLGSSKLKQLCAKPCKNVFHDQHFFPEGKWVDQILHSLVNSILALNLFCGITSKSPFPAAFSSQV